MKCYANHWWCGLLGGGQPARVAMPVHKGGCSATAAQCFQCSGTPVCRISILWLQAGPRGLREKVQFHQVGPHPWNSAFRGRRRKLPGPSTGADSPHTARAVAFPARATPVEANPARPSIPGIVPQKRSWGCPAAGSRRVIWGKARAPGPHVSRGTPEAVHSAPLPPRPAALAPWFHPPDQHCPWLAAAGQKRSWGTRLELLIRPRPGGRGAGDPRGAVASRPRAGPPCSRCSTRRRLRRRPAAKPRRGRAERRGGARR